MYVTDAIKLVLFSFSLRMRLIRTALLNKKNKIKNKAYIG